MLTLESTKEELMNSPTIVLNKLIEMAIGRVFKICSMRFQEGDIEQYEKCKFLITTAMEIINDRQN